MAIKIKPLSWTIPQILEATNGMLLFGNSEFSFSGVSIDSRKIEEKDLFVAVKGETFDGHDFIQKVVDDGCRGVIINSEKIKDIAEAGLNKKNIVCIAVQNCIRALGDMANYQRRRTGVNVAGITGSNGKTTTKEMTASVFSTKYKTLSTPGNFNNEIGLPLTLLQLGKTHEWAIIEMGMNHFGEIKELSKISKPDIGVVLNAGAAHIEGLGSTVNVAKAKCEIFTGLKDSGTAIVNMDDKNLLKLIPEIKSLGNIKEVVTFGKSKDADIKALSIKKDGDGISFILQLPEEEIDINLEIPGKFMVYNGLAAAAIAYKAGFNGKEIKKGLEQFKPVSGRMNIIKTGKGFNIINDTYNANPDSMEAAIRTLSNLRGRKRGFVVMGDMLELGANSGTFHKKIGGVVANLSLSGLFVYGTFSKAVYLGAVEKGMTPENVFTGEKDEIIKELKKTVGESDWILVKGSRSTKMEEVVEEIKIWGDE